MRKSKTRLIRSCPRFLFNISQYCLTASTLMSVGKSYHFFNILTPPDHSLIPIGHPEPDRWTIVPCISTGVNVIVSLEVAVSGWAEAATERTTNRAIANANNLILIGFSPLAFFLGFSFCLPFRFRTVERSMQILQICFSYDIWKQV